MRDYKNVKVPRKYRTGATRVSVKRVDVTRGTGRTRQDGAGIKRMLFNLLLFLLIAGGGWLGWQAFQLVTHAELFQISGVDVKGAQQIDESELKAIAGVFTGRNIFRVDLEEAVRRARSNPWVRDVRVHRSLPNRISMVFTERVPSAVLDTGAGRYVMDNDGVVIERLAKDGDAAWPLPVIAIKGAKAHPGETVPGEALPDAFLLLAEIASRGGWKPADVTVKADSPESVSIVYAGHEFKFGTGNYGEKFRRLAEVMKDVQQRNLDIAYVDLRAERQAAAMIVKQGSDNRQRSPSRKPAPGTVHKRKT